MQFRPSRDASMTPAEAFAVCEATVRRVDPDRYFASLFAPAEKRPLLHVLYAFNHELARAGETREPLAAEIRLQWWRDALESARVGRPRAHPVEIGLAETFSRGCLDRVAVHALIAARAIESSATPFDTLAAMESHADATSAGLMQIGARLLEVAGEAGELVVEAGIAYGLAGMLRSIPFHAALGKVFLPIDLLGDEGLTASDPRLGEHAAKVKRVVRRLASCTSNHFARARQIMIPRNALPVVLPAALVPLYLSRLAKSADPLRHSAEISQLRRLLIFLYAAARNQL